MVDQRMQKWCYGIIVSIRPRVHNENKRRGIYKVRTPNASTAWYEIARVIRDGAAE